jgi:hypothetical protein
VYGDWEASMYTKVKKRWSYVSVLDVFHGIVPEKRICVFIWNLT